MRKFQRRMVVDGVYYKGNYYLFKDIQQRLKPLIEQEMKPLEQISPVKQGNYLYRAVDEREWEQIKKDNFYFVPIRTNFEDTLGPQVQDYSQTEGYAGKVIRIKVQGPWFRGAGMAVPRVESITAFYSNVEVLEGDKWVGLKTS